MMASTQVSTSPGTAWGLCVHDRIFAHSGEYVGEMYPAKMIYQTKLKRKDAKRGGRLKRMMLGMLVAVDPKEDLTDTSVHLAILDQIKGAAAPGAGAAATDNMEENKYQVFARGVWDCKGLLELVGIVPGSWSGNVGDWDSCWERAWSRVGIVFGVGWVGLGLGLR